MAEPRVTNRRDIFGWIGVFVDVVQAVLFMAAILGALYWYATTRNGLAAVVVGIAAAVLLLAICMTVVIVSHRRR